MQDLELYITFFQAQESSDQMFGIDLSPFIVRKRNHFCS